MTSPKILPTLPESADVAVIGAGISGLVTARLLVASGVSPVVLEARDRVGGRLVTHQVDEHALDLGATWFWSNEPRVQALIAEFGLSVHQQHIAGDMMYQDARGAQRLAGNSIDVESGRFTNGAAALAEALASGLPEHVVLFDHAVESLVTDDDEARVNTSQGSVQAAHVVLALPPALVAHSIRVEPALPSAMAELAAATPVWMGNIAKVVAHYSEPFWRAEGLAGAAISHTGPLREIHDMCGPDGSPAALFGFAPVVSGQRPLSADAVVQQLVDIFGPQASAPQEVLVQDWSTEPFTSPPDAASLTAYEKFGHQLFQQPSGHGRLHWASTETSTVTPGHIEGAIAAAERAVASILRH